MEQYKIEWHLLTNARPCAWYTCAAAQPATVTRKKLNCVKCKTPYCSVQCQTLDWKERGHKKECKKLVRT